MSRRIDIVLPDAVAEQLHQLAAAAGEPPATLARHMLRVGITDTDKHGKIKQTRAAPRVASRSGGQRPRWLEPYGGDTSWRQEMWGAVVALHGRYPRHFDHLKTGWWNDEAHTETLCALATWRDDIDNTGQDPREELAFHHQLADYADTLRKEGGGVERTWKPGAPPADWAGQ